MFGGLGCCCFGSVSACLWLSIVSLRSVVLFVCSCVTSNRTECECFVCIFVVSVRGSTINNEKKRKKKELNTTCVIKKRKQRHLQQRKEDVKREEEDEEEGAASARARQMQCRRRGKTAFGFLHSLALFPSRSR